jgi:tetratricopeptide (TPR) repeat protein
MMVALNNFVPAGHAALGYVYAYQKQYDQAKTEIDQALILEPHFAGGYALQADLLSFIGKPEEAIGLVEKAMQLDPPPYADEYTLSLDLALYLAGRYEEVIAPLKRFLTRYPNRLRAHLSWLWFIVNLDEKLKHELQQRKYYGSTPTSHSQCTSNERPSKTR